MEDNSTARPGLNPGQPSTPMVDSLPLNPNSTAVAAANPSGSGASSAVELGSIQVQQHPHSQQSQILQNQAQNTSPAAAAFQVQPTFTAQSGQRGVAAAMQPQLMSRMNPMQYAVRTGMYTPQQQQQQALGINFGAQSQVQAATAAGGGGSQPLLLAQAGHLPMLAGQPTQLTNLQPHMSTQGITQPRQKGTVIQASQYSSVNPIGQQLQGMHPMGMMGGTLGLNSQIKATAAALPYMQQRIPQVKMRPQQQPLTSPQKLQAQGMPKVPSSPSMSSQLSGLLQNEQSSMMQNPLPQQQQQWLKQMQQATPTPNSSYILQQQQRQLLQQQLSSSPQSVQKQAIALSPQQASQFAQQQTYQLSKQQPQFQQQTLHQQPQPQQQQLTSPRVAGLGSQKTPNIAGSQPGTPASGVTAAGSSSQGLEASSRLLGSRRIQDLVAEVDPDFELDPELENMLLELADNFIDNVTNFSCSIARHRGSDVLETKDILFYLEKNYHLTVPGYSAEEPITRKELR